MMPSNVPRETSQTSGVSENVYDTWLTKAQAADAIGVTTKTVERLAADGKIQQALTQRQGRGPKLAVYHPDDVARMAQERRTTPSAFVLPAGVTAPVHNNGHGTSTALQITASTPAPTDDVLRLVFAAALRKVSETSETPAPFYVTVQEAAAILGLPQADVRALVHDGDLPHRVTRRGGIRIRRKDLEAV